MAPADEHASDAETFSFFLWSDTHFDGEGGGASREDAVNDMNRLAGAHMPAGYGTVDNVAFVLHSGDITTNARPRMWQDDNGVAGDDFVGCTSRLDYPVFEVRGNHDADGGRTCVADRVRERHGGLCYSFDRGGIHFVGLDFPDRPAKDGSPELEWLAADLASVDADTPVIFWQHRPPADDASWEPFRRIIAGHNVVMLFNGDSHQHRRYVWHGFDVWDGGHNDGRVNSWSGDPSCISVFKVENGRLIGSHYLTAEDRWETSYLINKPLARQ